MDPKRQYDALIAKRRAHPLFLTAEKYSEVHHIIPRCLGGIDDKSNLIRLTYKEHAFAHHMLWKMYPRNHQLALAFELMFAKNPPRRNQPGLILSSSIVAKLKIEANNAKRVIYEKLPKDVQHKISERASIEAKNWWKTVTDEEKSTRNKKISEALRDPHGKARNRTDEEIVQWKQKISQAQKNFSEDKKTEIAAKRKSTRQKNLESKSEEELRAIREEASLRTKTMLNLMTDEQKKAKSLKCSKASRKYWDNISDTEKQQRSKYTSERMTKRFIEMSIDEMTQFKQKLSNAKMGSRQMRRGNEQRVFMRDEIQEALANGWEFHGIDRSHLRGTSYWNNGKEQLLIKKEDESKFQKLGWTKGRLRRNKEYHYTGMKYRRWVHKDGKAIVVNVNDYETYIANGWLPGRK